MSTAKLFTSIWLVSGPPPVEPGRLFLTSGNTKYADVEPGRTSERSSSPRRDKGCPRRKGSRSRPGGPGSARSRTGRGPGRTPPRLCVSKQERQDSGESEAGPRIGRPQERLVKGHSHSALWGRRSRRGIQDGSSVCALPRARGNHARRCLRFSAQRSTIFTIPAVRRAQTGGCRCAAHFVARWAKMGEH